ncbi:unnamed protein product, partial [Prorocentrum cordatum]
MAPAMGRSADPRRHAQSAAKAGRQQQRCAVEETESDEDAIEELAKRRRVQRQPEAAAVRVASGPPGSDAICWHFAGRGFCLLGTNCPLRHPEEASSLCKPPSSAPPLAPRAGPRAALGEGSGAAATPGAMGRPGLRPLAPLAPAQSGAPPGAQAAALLKQATALRAPSAGRSWLDALAAEDDPGVPGVQA